MGFAGRSGDNSAPPSTLFQVNERPVTQQGMSGMRTAGQGPGRQVLDKTYFMAELRQKKAELIQITEKMEVKTLSTKPATSTTSAPPSPGFPL